MREITLKEYCDSPEGSQKRAGEIMSTTQGAVWQMLRDNREVLFVLDDSGSVVDFYEKVKPGQPRKNSVKAA